MSDNTNTFFTGLAFSTERDDWRTPQDFFDKLDNEFHFTLDACASESNYKCENYYTVEDDGLSQDWSGQVVFCNPPYGRSETGKWVKKGYEEGMKHNTTVVMLVPARTDTKWFHDYIYNKAEIRFIKGRLKFRSAEGKKPDRAPFPSMVVVYR